MRTVYTWRYELSPSESGRLTIKPARVRVRGKELRTAPVAITVDCGGHPARRGRGRDRRPRRTRRGRGAGARRVRRSTICSAARPIRSPPPIPAPRRPACRAGQLHPGGGRQAQGGGGRAGGRRVVAVPDRAPGRATSRWPSRGTDGFWIEDLPVPNSQGNMQPVAPEPTRARPTWRRRSCAGRCSRCAAGTLTITPLEAEISQVDFFGRSVRSQRLKAEPLAIEVDAAARRGPARRLRSGGGGQAGAGGRLDRQQVAVGDAVTLTVTVSGQGNLRKLVPPKLPRAGGLSQLRTEGGREGGTGGDRGRGQQGHRVPAAARAARDHHRSGARAGVFRSRDAATTSGARTEPLRIVVTGEAGKQPGERRAGRRWRPRPAQRTCWPPRSDRRAARAELSRDLGTTLYRSPGFFWSVLLPPAGLRR